jgi:hypothetical protein
VNPRERRFVRRIFDLASVPLRRGDERRFRVVVSFDKRVSVVQVIDDPRRVPVFEIRAFGFVTTRRDQFPNGFPAEKIRLAERAAKRLIDEI